MFKIGEFSQLTKVSIRMLRYYDEMDLLKPAAIDPDSDYRLYAAEQIAALEKIVLLRDMGLTVTEMKQALANWPTEALIEQLTAKKEAINEEIRCKQEQLQKIDIAINDWHSPQRDIHYNIIVKAIPSYPILSLRERIADYDCEGKLWQRLYAFVRAEAVPLWPGDHNLAIFHEETQRKQGIDVEVGLRVKKLGRDRAGFTYRKTEAVATMACIMVYGSYENIGPAYQDFAYWLQAHQHYVMNGPTRQICHRGAYDQVAPADYLTEIQVPVQKRPIPLTLSGCQGLD